MKHLSIPVRLRKFLSVTQGFTLIELLVVIAIIGVLTTMVASNFQTSRIKANDARRKSDLTQIQKALEMYVADHGSYPASDTQGRILGCGTGTPCAWGQPWQDAKGTTYMATLPADSPSPEYSYFYLASSDHRKYQIFAQLQNVNDASNDTTLSHLCGSLGACTYGISSQNSNIHEAF